MTENVMLLHGDARHIPLPDNSVDSVVCDPPYGLEFMGRSWDSFRGGMIDPGFLHWFAGFTDGEGCFSVHKKNVNGYETYDCQFSITLRADDRPILERIHDTLKIGTLSKPTAGRTGHGNPQTRFSVSAKAQLCVLRDIFVAFPLRAKKAQDFAIWSQALDAWLKHEPGEWEDMRLARETLMDSRAYKEHGVRVNPFQMWVYWWAREALRVLKPGGYLLAMGGTRTAHRLAAGIEDAGFEIRDTLSYMYGSGFPKSLDVGKAFDRQRDDLAAVRAVAFWLRERLSESDLNHRQVADRFGVAESMVRHWIAKTGETQTQCPSWKQWEQLSDLLGFGDEMDAEVWRLNGRKGQPGEAWHEREKVGEAVGTNAVHESGVGGRAVGIQQERITVDITAPATELAQQWDGWGTALKPAHEPIVMARKPLIGTVAANVEAYGTGGLNIDATRIETRDSLDGGSGIATVHPGWDRPWKHKPETMALHADRVRANIKKAEKLGRWPPNVALGCNCEDEHEEGCAVALLDAQSGERPSGTGDKSPRQHFDNAIYGGGLGYSESQGIGGDSGGASRFYYTAKASRSEREAGLVGEGVTAAERTGRRPGSAGLVMEGGKANPYAGNSSGVTRNHHPTVKPIALMRWLIRLVTPPGGTVLDPFMGSGTTGCAAVLEGDTFIGLEREADYLAIAEQRIRHWLPKQLELWT